MRKKEMVEKIEMLEEKVKDIERDLKIRFFTSDKINACGRWDIPELKKVELNEAIKLIMDHLNIRFASTPPEETIIVSKEKE